MDDLKIVFYIVVAIIWMVYNNYRKISEQSKKRDPSKPVPDIIEENWPSEPAPTAQPVPHKPYKAEQQRSFKRKEYLPRPAPVPKPPVMERKPLYKERLSSQYKPGMFLPSQREGGSIQPSKMVKFEDVVLEPETVNEVALEIRNADFRQAIILSEVLKRPYN